MGETRHSGHYFTFSKNTVNNNWYCYNDKTIIEISQTELVTKYAYILVYTIKKSYNRKN